MAKICPVCGSTYPDANVFCPLDGSSLQAQNASGDLVGTVIADRYLVSQLLGEGGMGRVYLARHVRLPQQAAIKVMHPGMMAEQDAVARFNREAANAARIEHDRVARVFDFGETSDGLVYLAMEFVPGRTLRALLAELGRLSPTRAANLSYQVAEGLDAAHRIGIVHRDLKPDNILVVTDEQGVDRSKVVDFGIAKATDAKGTQLTRTGTIVGTPEYMSPEQVVGESLDARSDVYALALVSFHMFTGTLPFAGATPERAIMSRLMEEPLSLAAAVPEVAWPPDLQAAFTRALDREPAARTPSALEFAEAVVAAVEAWTGTAVFRARTPLNVTAQATPTSPPAAVVSAPTPVASTAATTTPPPRPRTPARAVYISVGVAAVAGLAWFAATRFSSAAPEPTVARDTTAAPVASPSASPVGTKGPAGSTSKGSTVPPNVASRGADSTAAPTPTPPPSTSTAGGAAARVKVDSIQRVLLDPASGEEEARAAIPQLQRLLPSLASATDSTWAYLALVSAYGQANEPLQACNPLRSANRLATTDAQRRAVRTYFNSEALACVP